jgi:hypothetical protein
VLRSVRDRLANRLVNNGGQTGPNERLQEFAPRRWLNSINAADRMVQRVGPIRQGDELDQRR